MRIKAFGSADRLSCWAAVSLPSRGRFVAHAQVPARQNDGERGFQGTTQTTNWGFSGTMGWVFRP
ncbi:hypothetical protein ROBYS_30140 [Roseobacter sp. OBYS 0001]|nr:hypothetical protein ROBYS_30140 [Roseobacter sp. OBYS 0001]